ncbi:beta-2-microglobulin [Brachyhypopomus gauderio]|uniref:beta-2-microglobulin n=1 Tax=Brachyhypopomus gauderio TaxID=698409 RepID=UPI0040435E76
MRLFLSFAVLCTLYFSVQAKESPPKVQVYSYSPGEYGKDNVLICHVSGFHPPDITIELLKDGAPIPDTKQTDLAFEQGWKFHLTKSVAFTPQKSQEYSCRVRHLQSMKDYSWEPDM